MCFQLYAEFLKKNKYSYQTLTDTELPDKIANLIANEKVIGWFQGRMEFGPRALGSRTIIGDARSPEMQKTMNLKIKYRESFRPFAPSVTREDLAEWFELNCDSPYMLLVAGVNKSIRREMNQEEFNSVVNILKVKYNLL